MTIYDCKILKMRKSLKKNTEVYAKGPRIGEHSINYCPLEAKPKSPTLPSSKMKSGVISSALQSVLVAMLPKKSTSDLSKLESYLQDRELRDEIINQLLSAHSDGPVKIRFVSAVNDYQNTPDQIVKQKKARNIVAVFVQEGSKFHLPDIPIAYEQDLVKSRFKNLLLLKELMLRELLKNPIVTQFLKSAEDHSIEHQPTFQESMTD